MRKVIAVEMTFYSLAIKVMYIVRSFVLSSKASDNEWTSLGRCQFLSTSSLSGSIE